MTELLTDVSVGETRQALIEDGRPVALVLWRWSERGKRARWGEVYEARVRAADTRRRGAFLDLGIAEQGFVRLDGAGRARIGDKPVVLREGQAVRAVVKREAARGKSPVLAIETLLPSIDRVRCVDSHESSVEPEKSHGEDARERLDAIFEAALSPIAAIPGGGRLSIEPTAALVAIDVDAGERVGSGDAERFASALNVDAAREAMRQLRLRNLGGLAAIDFVSMRERAGREATMEALRTAGRRDPWGVQIAPMSRFGVVELSRGQLRRPIIEQMCDETGRPTAETQALAALRGVEREARTARGKMVIARVADDLGAWLDTGVIDWRSGLTARIGPRWEVRREPGLPPGAWSVEAP